MGRILKKRSPILNGKELWYRYWVEMGEARSIRRIINELTERGIINPDNSRPFTPMSVWFSMNVWSMRNPDEAYETMNTAMRDEGKFITRAQFDEDLQWTVWTMVRKSTSRFNLWLKRTKSVNLIGV
jgi:hypothetical protein